MTTRREMIAEETVHAQVARMIYDARTAAGLTQKQLAELIGTQQSTIARLEDADYQGHSLSMLRRIAEALHQKLEVRFVPTRAAQGSWAASDTKLPAGQFSSLHPRADLREGRIAGRREIVAEGLEPAVIRAPEPTFFSGSLRRRAQSSRF